MIQSLPLSLIYDPRKVSRSLQQDAVAKIAESLERIGLRVPITVRKASRYRDDHPADVWEVVSGRHRVAAARHLGWRHIDAMVSTGDPVEDRLWEISENLHRAELTPLEQSEHIAEWVRLTGKKGAQNEPPCGGRQPHDKGIKAAVRELGIERNEAQRAVKVDSLSPEAKQAARDAGLDKKQSALLAAASERTAEAQVAKVKDLAAEAAEKAKDKAKRLADAKAGKRKEQAAGDQIVQLDANTEAALLILDFVPPDHLSKLLSHLDAGRHHKLAAAIRRELVTGDRRAGRPVFDSTRGAI